MLSLQDKEKNLKKFNFHNNADEMEKQECFQNRYFFSEKEDLTVNDVRDIGYVGRSNNTIAVY